MRSSGRSGGYIALIGWLRSNSLNGGISALGNVPVADLLLILLGMPAFAAIVALALRRPRAVGDGASADRVTVVTDVLGFEWRQRFPGRDSQQL